MLGSVFVGSTRGGCVVVDVGIGVGVCGGDAGVIGSGRAYPRLVVRTIVRRNDRRCDDVSGCPGAPGRVSGRRFPEVLYERVWREGI